MKHQTKLTLTSTTPEHIGLKNRPRGKIGHHNSYKLCRSSFSNEKLVRFSFFVFRYSKKEVGSIFVFRYSKKEVSLIFVFRFSILKKNRS